MGISTIGATGVPLPPPGALYPNTIGLFPQLVGTNGITLPPGGDILIPSGTFLVSPGVYSQVQVLCPVSQTWRPYSASTANEPMAINSDGVNYRVWNATGFPIGAIVTNGGTGFTSAPTVAANIGGSTWLAIVGGAVSQINATATFSGVNYSVPPIINIAAPPAPGVQATAVCAISGGSITGFTVTNPGAGYTSAPPVVIMPQQSDINANSTSVAVTNARATAQLSFVGVVTAVLMTNEGNNPLSVAPALTFTGGGGSSAAATAVMALTVTGWSITTAGSAMANSGGVTIQSTGGALQALTSGLAAAATSVVLGANLLVPRNVNIIATISGAGGNISALTGSALSATSGILDGGIFTTIPTLYVPGNNTTCAAVVGGANDTVFITPL